MGRSSKVAALFVALPLLAACGQDPHDSRHTYKGEPIDCIEEGSGNNATLSCDFVGWHQKYDPVPSYPAPTSTP